jgi:hypothetical protein
MRREFLGKLTNVFSSIAANVRRRFQKPSYQMSGWPHKKILRSRFTSLLNTEIARIARSNAPAFPCYHVANAIHIVAEGFHLGGTVDHDRHHRLAGKPTSARSISPCSENRSHCVARAQIEAFSKALDTFRLDVGRYQTTEEGLSARLVQPAESPTSI